MKLQITGEIMIYKEKWKILKVYPYDCFGIDLEKQGGSYLKV